MKNLADWAAITNEGGIFPTTNNNFVDYVLKHTTKTVYNDLYPLNFDVDSDTTVDYPDFANKLTNKIKEDNCNIGILICGSGIGMSIAANRKKGIRAGLCYNPEMAELMRKHNNANVITLGARLTKKSEALKCVNVFLKTNFDKGRHLRRIKKI